MGSGAHRGAGTPHAEPVAIKEAGGKTGGASLYVSLEPCNHFGRTPPCTDAIVAAGIKEVYFGFADPNPKVKGGGTEALRDKNIRVVHFEDKEIYEFYKSYAYWCRTGLPRVTAKLAVSKDGMIAGPQGVKTAITGPEANEFTHVQRHHADAILTSVRTVMADDPRLNARVGAEAQAKPVYVLDPHLSFPQQANLRKTSRSLTLFHEKGISEERAETLRKEGFKLQPVPVQGGRLKWESILKCIGQEGVHDLWVEAGGRVFESMVREGYVHKAYWYVSPQSLGAGAYPGPQSFASLFERARSVHWSQAGADSICSVEW